MKSIKYLIHLMVSILLAIAIQCVYILWLPFYMVVLIVSGGVRHFRHIHTFSWKAWNKSRLEKSELLTDFFIKTTKPAMVSQLADRKWIVNYFDNDELLMFSCSSFSNLGCLQCSQTDRCSPLRFWTELTLATRTHWRHQINWNQPVMPNLEGNAPFHVAMKGRIRMLWISRGEYNLHNLHHIFPTWL